ncbi:hypothetical protein LAV84_23140 [Rhizobium sp. VS19-DR104.2]|uniref:hypothetical protein n=1 Tax=unclassified Rhizobium TaxID=2613769 RepID=UPI001C5A998C|nr:MULTISPECIES: hypothetical protein [unclassified Rhizobium]MBZ5762077.1 hypothetical protein [Rhizobium sp. VS19-DR96]MBZ5768190.1 hypothetical protein [Rhizobium sp. VS19-DR129.2]MBZ5775745.1 hypothetical protein [Rhizobium sp. VS19-DRK62.2]MBZ5786954.1 hypothetical protein [Rhizobium sp. VS19-DR121]MBZ5804115.1 hypothetical protein [Rhizobium sp. VS19-DR181]
MRNTASKTLTLALCYCIFILSSCISGLSETQRAYDACTTHWNNEINYKPEPKAAVAGVDGDRTSCFWAWSQPSGKAAAARALADCRKQYQRCFVYYESGGGFSPWERRVNANGGHAPDAGGGQGNNSNGGDELAAAMITGLATGLAAANGARVAPPVSYNAGAGTTYGVSGACDDANVQSQIAALQARASSLGICQMAREYAVVLRQAATAYRRCGQNQNASNMDAAATQSDATASQSCMN